MLLDKQLELSNAQAITASASSTNVVDLGPKTGAGKNSLGTDGLNLHLQVDEAFTAAGAATMSITIRSSDSENMSSPTLHTVTDAIPKASLGLGAKIDAIPVPRGVKRYVDAYYTVATGPMTAGKITARIGGLPHNNG